MFKRNLLHLWLGILVLSGAFLLGQEAWVPSCDFDVEFADPMLESAIRGAILKYDGSVCASDLATLTELDLSGLNITNLSGLEYCINLYLLDLRDNLISDLTPLAGMTGLSTLALSGNQISDIAPLAGLAGLTWLALDENQISDLSPLAGLANLYRLEAANNQISDLTPLEGLHSLWELDLSGNRISDLSSLEGLTGLGWLHLNDNLISDLTPLAALTGLGWLYLDDNQISDLSPLAGLPLTWELHLDGNQISDLSPLAGRTSMWELHLAHNDISDLSPLAGMTTLWELDLAYNRISDLSPLAGILVFYGLNFESNQISDLGPLAGLSTLYTLRLANNQISDLGPLAGFVSVHELSLAHNRVSDLGPLAGLSTVYDLDLEGNDISDLSPLAGIAIDYRLSLSGNQVADVGPLAASSDLHELGLGDNQISDITPLEGMTSLEHLDLSDNLISSIHSLVANLGIGSGDTVLLGSNPLSAGSCTVHIPQLQSRGATVVYSCSFPMAQIPEGCFDMGDHFSEADPNPLPVHNVCISAFEMDFQEVTNGEYAECVFAGACAPPSESTSATRLSYYGDPAYDDFPVIRVSWYQAEDYCAWMGKRLPTDAEWEYAARGGLAGNRYPWGDTISGADANYLDSGDPWDNDTSAIEYFPPNGYGLYDVAGNVWEWVRDWYEEGYYDVSPTDDPPGPASGLNKVIRGGSWNSDAAELGVGFSASLNASRNNKFVVGFRCARGGAYGP